MTAMAEAGLVTHAMSVGVKYTRTELVSINRNDMGNHSPPFPQRYTVI